MAVARMRQTSMRSKKKGLPPGSLIHIGPVYSDKTQITLNRYSPEFWKTDEIGKGKLKIPHKGKDETLWYQITGLAEPEPMESLFAFFGLDPLISEDILNTQQPSKIYFGKGYIALTLKYIQWYPDKTDWESEQLSLVLKPDLIVTFAERPSSLMKPLQSRLENPSSKIRNLGPDFTFYSILDLLVDEYLENCEKLEIFVDDLELRLEENLSFDPTSILHQVRKFQIYFRQQVMPVREGVAELIRDSDDLIDPSELPYFQDILDHLNQVIASIDQIKENTTNIRELYQSQLTLKMNKVIHFLTLVSTIFIPLTWIVGIYGMNFDTFPELRWKYGYFAVMIVMLVIGSGMYLYFRRKKWM